MAKAKSALVCYTAVFSGVTKRSAVGDDTKNGCVAD